MCDVDTKRVAAGKGQIEKFHRDAGTTAANIATYADYRELLAQKDIDAVVISLPDHQHAEVAIAAVRAGKDVYLQKPFTMREMASSVPSPRCRQ